MKKRKELIAKRASLTDEAKAVHEQAKAEERELTEAEAAQVDALLDEAEGINSEIAKLDAAAQADARLERLASATAVLDDPGTARSVGAVDSALEAASRVTGGRDRRELDPRRGFASMADFAMRVYEVASPEHHGYDERLDICAAASGMNAANGAGGGWAMPPEFSTTIWEGMVGGMPNLLDRTDMYTVTGESLVLLANAETDLSGGAVFGGALAYWLAEADQIPSSKPKLRQVKLEPQELAALIYVTNKLLKGSSVALEQYIGRSAARAINLKVGESIINGTGSGQPLGILNSAATIVIAKESQQAAASLKKKNIDKMYARCFAPSRQQATFYTNQDIEPELEDLSAVVGTGGIPVYLPAGGFADAPNARLKGRPVEPIPYCQTLGTKGDIILADLKAYATGVRGTVDTAMSMHLRFDYAETAFRVMFAVDGQPWPAAPLTPLHGSKTLAPFVALADRS